MFTTETILHPRDKSDTLGIDVSVNFHLQLVGYDMLLSGTSENPLLVKLSYIQSGKTIVRIFPINGFVTTLDDVSEITSYIPLDTYKELGSPENGTLSPIWYNTLKRAHRIIIQPDKKEFYNLESWEDKLKVLLSTTSVISKGMRLKITGRMASVPISQDESLKPDFMIGTKPLISEWFTVVGILVLNDTDKYIEVDYAGILNIDVEIDFVPSQEAQKLEVEKKLEEKHQADLERERLNRLNASGNRLGGNKVDRLKWLDRFNR